MPLPQPYLSEFAFAELKEKVLAAFGQRLKSKGDCDRLSEAIEFKTKRAISVNTIRRVYDVMPTGSKPSNETLNILSFYCGYSDFIHFQQSVVSKVFLGNPDLTCEAVNDLFHQLGETPQFYTSLMWAMQLAFRDNNLLCLKDFFDLDVFKDKSDYTQGEFKKVLMAFGVELQSSPKVFDNLIDTYARNPKAQSFYFECFVDYDFLAARHHRAIQSYSKAKQVNEAQLFSLCILFLYAFLLKDRVTCEGLLKQINSVKLSIELHPYPIARRMACNILFQSFYLRKVNFELINSIFEYEKQMPRNGSLGRNTPIYHTLVAEALTWSGYYDEALTLIQLAQKNYCTEANYFNQGVLSTMRICEADALLKSNRRQEGLEVFNKIDVSHFDLNCRQFTRMNY